MRYFLDTEFNGFCGDLISIALVPEDDGRAPFYAAIECSSPTPWVVEHIMPVLDIEPMSRSDVADRFADYLGDDPEPQLVADWPEDIAHAARLLVIGPGLMKPVRNIRFHLVDAELVSSGEGSAVPHNAYQDALRLRADVLAYEKRLAG
ncbi:hypothetical protein C8024_07560 [Sphingopyxis sp. BSNA05]|uniref:hypothetical protein n=1 Tax=Sphingopyxis sp. BSNA05 TaxID=1236614 RepID=UPI001566EB78|nr:hypothetical protein [Sphingopyxis sp. BSNA05]NRD89330.1 hypothetical protein [Sphingopyxis sp. BSNA05]